jgi:molybdate transport system substrate-binding protein
MRAMSATRVGALAALLTVAVVLPAAVLAQELAVAAPPGMSEGVQHIARELVVAHPEARVRFVFGGAFELQRRIEAGESFDVVIAAAARPVEELVSGGLVAADSVRPVARNSLTAVRTVDSGLDVPGPSNLLDRRVRRIAIGDPQLVPSGLYAQEMLTTLSLWKRLEPKLQLADSSRQAVERLLRGEADVAVVFITDALPHAERLREAFQPPAETHSPIVYLAGALARTTQPALAREFIGLIASPAGQLALARLGFHPVEPR